MNPNVLLSLLGIVLFLLGITIAVFPIALYLILSALLWVVDQYMERYPNG